MTANTPALPGENEIDANYQDRRETVWKFLDDCVSNPHLWIAAEALLLGNPQGNREQDIVTAMDHLDHLKKTPPKLVAADTDREPSVD